MKTFIALLAFVTNICQANVERFSITSKIIDETTTVRVSLPDTYTHSSSFSYPLLIVLDGATQFPHVAASTQFLSTYAILPEMVVVGVSTHKRLQYFTPTEHEEFVGRSGQASAFKAYLHKELLPSLKSKYRIAPYYVVSGHSMGGLFTSYLALQNESEFNAHIAISPSLWWDEKTLMDTYLSTEQLTQPKRWFLSMANEPGEMNDSYVAMLDALKKKPVKNLYWFSQRFAEETHDSTPLIGNAQALKSLFHNWNAVPEVDVMSLQQLQVFYQHISGEYGYNFPLSAHQYNVYGLKAAYEGKTAWGVEILEQGVKHFAQSEILWDSLATAYNLDSKPVKALSASKQALQLAKTNDSIYLHEITSQNNQLMSKVESLNGVESL
ncbi:alpha/beta hydrolase-fold protein [Pseudoalteromonas sp. MMG022]|uniref:alpha/beta hydrolase n=1 Tax=Pseudoalteromonas sp. MMG022 TaxID=2909978 RepID=UPI001EEDEE81|nr:alpha/beta hydrolase-fold protein [Pseudoalteromonas sp. MMG022]MCF6437583.1 alpha/beta hydrolase [Pseudoalteromonas sp. MMG022]